MRRLLLHVGALTAALALSGCRATTTSTAPTPLPTGPTGSFAGPVAGGGNLLPSQSTCEGGDRSPELTWSSVGDEGRFVAVSLRDVDLPGGEFTHWLVAGIPAGSGALAEGRVPAGAVEGRNDFGTVGYSGPCPPRGDPPHRYVFSLYALRAQPGLAPGFTAEEFRDEVVEKALSLRTFVRTYARA